LISMENSELRPSNARQGPRGQIVAFEGKVVIWLLAQKNKPAPCGTGL
jgi:hypothetical protein